MPDRQTEHPKIRRPDPPADLRAYGEGFPTIGRVGVRSALAHPGARRWYLGFSVGVVWLGFIFYQYFQSTQDLWMRVLAITLILVFAAAGAVAVPVAWWLPLRQRLWASVALFALSFILWPIMGWQVDQVWVYVGMVIGMSMFTMRTSYVCIGTLTVLTIVFQMLGGSNGESVFWLPALVASLSMMMAGFARQIAAINQLRVTQHELAELAVAEERNRVARDIHDILGHSLTAITVKAELAGMLIDGERATEARNEVAAVEELARGALADVRSTVAGYRGVNVVGELANARSMLESAGIRAELPATVDELPARLRELGGWVVREGVTNVVRHSDASVCRITIEPDVIEVADDGRGPGAAAADGNGLRGLRERAASNGCLVQQGRSDLGGFSLRLVDSSPSGAVDAVRHDERTTR